MKHFFARSSQRGSRTETSDEISVLRSAWWQLGLSRRVIIGIKLWAACASLLLVSDTLQGTTVVAPEFAELVNDSDFVVRSKVRKVNSSWETHNGQRHIFTTVELDVVETLGGTPPKPLVLLFLGGRVGNEELVIEGVPSFVVGQEDILFVRGNGRQFCPLTAVSHGRYPLTRGQDGVVRVNRSNHSPLHKVNEVVLPLEHSDALHETKRPEEAEDTPGMSVEDFSQAIRTALAPKNKQLLP